jgi:hypothetical protein
MTNHNPIPDTAYHFTHNGATYQFMSVYSQTWLDIVYPWDRDEGQTHAGRQIQEIYKNGPANSGYVPKYDITDNSISSNSIVDMSLARPFLRYHFNPNQYLSDKNKDNLVYVVLYKCLEQHAPKQVVGYFVLALTEHPHLVRTYNIMVDNLYIVASERGSKVIFPRMINLISAISQAWLLDYVLNTDPLPADSVVRGYILMGLPNRRRKKPKNIQGFVETESTYVKQFYLHI